MTHELQTYIEAFDFSIIKTKSMIEVIEEHRTTAFYAFRFGGGLTIKRDRKISVPAIAEKYEAIYIQKILQAISEKAGQAITSLEELYKQFPIYTRAIQVHRERFYSAENLKLFSFSTSLLGCPICNQMINPCIITPENEEESYSKTKI